MTVKSILTSLFRIKVIDVKFGGESFQNLYKVKYTPAKVL